MPDFKDLVSSLEKEGVFGDNRPTLKPKAAPLPISIIPEPEETKEIPTPVEIPAEVLEPEELEELLEGDFLEDKEPAKETILTSENDLLNKLYIIVDQLKTEVEGLRADLKQAGVRPTFSQPVQTNGTPVHNQRLTPAQLLQQSNNPLRNVIKLGEQVDGTYGSPEDAYRSLDMLDGPRSGMNHEFKIKPIEYERFYGKLPSVVTLNTRRKGGPPPIPTAAKQPTDVYVPKTTDFDFLSELS